MLLNERQKFFILLAKLQINKTNNNTNVSERVLFYLFN